MHAQYYKRLISIQKYCSELYFLNFKLLTMGIELLVRSVYALLFTEQVSEYIYLGQIINFQERNQEQEIKRRITAGWKAFGRNSDIIKSSMPIYLNAKGLRPVHPTSNNICI